MSSVTIESLEASATAATGFAAPARLIPRIPPIPDRSTLHGPLTARRLRRFYAFLALLFLAGIAPSLLQAAPAWRAFGLGLLFPGAGFLYAGGVSGVLLALASFVVCLYLLFMWWARGILPAPPVALVGTATLAALWKGATPGVHWLEWAVPAAVAFIHLELARRRAKSFQEARRRGQALSQEIEKVEPILRDFAVTAMPEMPPSQIADFRRMLDLALQPVESWNGFSMADTWQEGALRYQICTMSWNLALGQYTRLPAFHGYLNQAQENLIRKHIDRKTWNYWFWESLWGNFRYQRNPIETDNIMLSGFLGTSLGLFETASGTSPFAAPGALTFRWDEQTAFVYNHQSLLQEVERNFRRYDYGWFPCEPRWIYSMCNLVGRTALALHDRRHGTALEASIAERFEKTMDEEMTLADGRVRVVTSALCGFTVPSCSGLFGETWGIRFLTHCAPDKAERLWQILKRQFFARGPDGKLVYTLLPWGWDTRAPSNFSRSRWPELYPLMMTLWAALEMGDEEIVEATSMTMDERYGAGTAASQIWSGRNTIRDMVLKGLPKPWATGPLLAEAAYPDVIVGRAVSDGQALDLVLHPGAEGGIKEIGFSRLIPARRYRVVQTGAEFAAGADGKARLAVTLDGRTELNLVPVT